MIDHLSPCGVQTTGDCTCNTGTLKWALDQYISGDATAERTLVRVASVVYGQPHPFVDVTGGAGEAHGAQVAPVDVETKQDA